MSAAPAAAPDEPVQPSTAQGPAAGVSNIEKNTELASKPGSIWWWVVVAALYVLWDYFQTRDKLSSALQPRNIRANLHNLIVVTIAAVIGINGFNVFLTKLAAMKIPLLSRAAGTVLPLFHL